MPTPEEILSKKNWSTEYPNYMAEHEILEAMNVYAQQEAIEFAEWIAVNGWYFNKIKRWSNRNESSENLIEVLSATKTTKELYQLFKQQKP